MAMDDKEVEALKRDYESRLANEVAARETVIQEFSTIDPEDAEAVAKVRSEITALVPDAKRGLEFLVNHADSENVRASMIKFVLETAMSKGDKDKDADGINDLVDRLTKKQKQKKQKQPVDDE